MRFTNMDLVQKDKQDNWQVSQSGMPAGEADQWQVRQLIAYGDRGGRPRF